MEQPALRKRFRPYDPQHLPPRRKLSPARAGRRLLGWAVLFVLLGVLIRFDLVLMQWRYALLPEGPDGLFKEMVRGFREFGQITAILVSMAIVIRIDQRRRTIIACMLAAQLFANVVYNSGKLTIGRYRPFAAVEIAAADAPESITPQQQDAWALSQMTPGQSWLGWMPGNRDSKRQAFPSGHSGAAFAHAAVLAWFYPRLAGIFWVLATGCAVSRYVDGVHWLGDCMAGAMIGHAAAWLALRPQAWSVFAWWQWRGKGEE